MRQFHAANTLPASYLFHSSDEEEAGKGENKEIYDLADLTLQCGRRGDSLKLALGWIFYGKEGYASQIEHAFDTTAYLASLVSEHQDFVLVSENPPPCLQVCFYYARNGRLNGDQEKNSVITKKVAEGLVRRGFMVDYAGGEKGMFLRCVVNRGTRRETVEGLVTAVAEVGGALS